MKNRNIINIIEEIKDLYHNYGIDIEDFIYNIDTIKYSVSFTAPELIYIRWRELYNYLTETLLNGDNKTLYDYNFTIKCFSIFSGNSEEEIRKEIN